MDGEPLVPSFVILGAGYTGQRVAARLRSDGLDVVATNRKVFDVTDASTHANLERLLSPHARVLHSIPVLRTEAGYQAPMPVLAPLLTKCQVQRVVYISTTGVYGDAHHVDETEEEQAVQAGPWSSLVLRPAAIYGPERGIHRSMATGTYRLVGDGANFISRIHVDDLAAICAAALLSDLTGAYPVADRQACPAREIAEYCSKQFGYPMPPSEALPADDSRRSDRRVDGRAITRLLDVALRYPSYREGLALPAPGNNLLGKRRAIP
jgi:nucleoside-diphosphate-sugar epimerase